MLVSSDIFTRPWILLTSMFMHANPNHLFFNMFALFMFGPVLEQRIGMKRFLYIYFLSGLLAGIFFALTPFGDAGLGASGAIMGMLGVTIILLPDLQVLFFFIIPMSLRTAGIIFAAIDLLGLFGIGMGGVANSAHLAGLVTGLGYGMYLKKRQKKVIKRFKKKRSMEISKEDMADFLKHGRL